MTTSKNVKAQASKAQAQAQVGAQAQKRTRKSAKAQAKAYKYAVVGTYTYDGGKNNGKTVPCVDVATRFRSQDFRPLNDLAHTHNGGWSKFASKGVSRFLFDTVAHAEAFADALDKAVAKGTFVADPTNISGRKARKAAGLPAHTPEWYAARKAREEKAAAKAAKPAKVAKAKKGEVDIEAIVAKAVAAALASIR